MVTLIAPRTKIEMTEREKLVELVNKLFIYTDNRQWDLLQSEVFSDRVFLDMTSMGGQASELTSKDICDMWSEGFKELDAVNHLGGNYLIQMLSDTESSVFAYATATHFKASATKGKTREFVGTYDLKMKRIEGSWRICSFIYHLKYAAGNLDLA